MSVQTLEQSVNSKEEDPFMEQAEDYQRLLKKAFKGSFLFSQDLTRHFLKYVMGKKGYTLFSENMIASSLRDLLSVRNPAVLEQIAEIMKRDPTSIPTTEELLSITSKTTLNGEGRLYKVTTSLPQNAKLTNFVREYFSRTEFEQAILVQKTVHDLALAHNIHVSIPEPRYVDEKYRLIGNPFIDGQNLQDALKTCTPAQKKAYITQGLDIIAENMKFGAHDALRSPQPKKGLSKLNPFSKKKPLVPTRTNYASIFDRLVIHRINPSAEFSDLEALMHSYKQRIADSLDHEDAYFVHGDLFPMNFMVQQDSLVPIDWNTSMFGLVQTDILKFLSKSDLNASEEESYLDMAYQKVAQRGYANTLQQFKQVYSQLKVHEFLIIAARHLDRAHASSIKKGINQAKFEDTANIYFTKALQELEAMRIQDPQLSSKLEQTLTILSNGRLKRLTPEELEQKSQRLNPFSYNSQYLVEQDDTTKYVDKVVDGLRKKHKRKTTVKTTGIIASSAFAGALGLYSWQNNVIPRMWNAVGSYFSQTYDESNPLNKSDATITTQYNPLSIEVAARLNELSFRDWGLYRENNPECIKYAREEFNRLVFGDFRETKSVVETAAKQFGIEETVLSAVVKANAFCDIDKNMKSHRSTLGATNLPMGLPNLYFKDAEADSLRAVLETDNTVNVQWAAKLLKFYALDNRVKGDRATLLTLFYGGDNALGTAQMYARMNKNSKNPESYDEYHKFLEKDLRDVVELTLGIARESEMGDGYAMHGYSSGDINDYFARSKIYSNLMQHSALMVREDLKRMYPHDSTKYASDIDILRHNLNWFDSFGWMQEISQKTGVREQALRGLVGLSYFNASTPDVRAYLDSKGYVGLVPQLPDKDISKQDLEGDPKFNLEHAAKEFGRIYKSLLPKSVYDNGGIPKTDSAGAELQAMLIFMSNNPRIVDEAKGKNHSSAYVNWADSLPKPFQEFILAFNNAKSMGHYDDLYMRH